MTADNGPGAVERERSAAERKAMLESVASPGADWDAGRLLSGSGEMADLLRKKDWSKTRVGPMAAWPQSLRTAVDICLGSRHPIVLWWGPERTMFYNDAYRPMLGASKHPQFLGESGEDCWKEIWPIIGPMMASVIATGEATWSEDLYLLMNRSDYLEETYFTFSYSPLRDDAGRVFGIFNACTETTGRVLGERRLRTLRDLAVDARTTVDLGRHVAEALGRNRHDVPLALLYLPDSSETHLRLIGCTGLPTAEPASPVEVRLDDERASAWPLARVFRNGLAEIVEDLPQRFTALPEAPWDVAPEKAMLLPLLGPGSSRPVGVLVLAISPRRAFDDDYQGFFRLVAGSVGTAVVNARAVEVERERAERLAALDRAKTAFFSNVSHELRTPLTLILGPVEDALARPSSTLAGEDLEVVHRGAVRLLRLVNNLLDFARIEAGRLQMRFAPIDLALATRDLVSAFRSLVERAGLELGVDCPTLPEPVFVDPWQWEKIVLNLMSNAFKFTLVGRIDVSLRWQGASVELTVRDTGTGIPASELPHIFERFRRVEGAVGRSFEGTGIGLSLVEELVQLHGGAIRVTSVEGEGSAFVVSMPTGSKHLPPDELVRGEVPLPPPEGADSFLLEAAQWLSHDDTRSDSSAASSLGEPGAAAASLRQSARVLIVDDNADMRHYLARLLSPLWSIELAEDGLRALMAARRHPPDLVLSDVMMPGMGGTELVRALRASPETREIPVVLLSARAGEESLVAGLETGADDYLVKPFSARELVARVQTHLEMARLRRQWAHELERMNHELESFTYSVSHDLRAPLRAIDGFGLALIEDCGEELGEVGQQHIRRIRSATRRMSELIEDLLGLAGVARIALQREAVDLTQLVERIVDELRARDPARIVDVRVEPGMVASADPRLLMVLLENLLGNAWKFTAKKARSRIEVGRETRGNEILHFVRDDGVGFEMDHASRLFSPFVRLHSEAEFEGHGIGLATAQRVVLRHGGRIWADAARDRGSTFFFTLGNTLTDSAVRTRGWSF